MAGPDFSYYQGNVMLVGRDMYGLKSYVAAFRDPLDEQLHDLGYRPSIADTAIWMQPEVRPGGFVYYEYVLLYIDDVLCISDLPVCTMKLIQ